MCENKILIPLSKGGLAIHNHSRAISIKHDFLAILKICLDWFSGRPIGVEDTLKKVKKQAKCKKCNLFLNFWNTDF